MSKLKKPSTAAIFEALKRHGFNASAVAREMGVPERTMRHWVSEMDVRNDEELIEHNVHLARQSQRQQDLNRIKNKAFREDSRVINALEDYVKSLSEVFSKHSLNKLTKKHKTKKCKAVGVIQLTDLHFNELVELEHNQYNFDIAGKRIKLHIDKATKYFKSIGITEVFLAFTGDLMNSDRRLDELLAKADNRAKATFLAVDILQQAILDLNKHFNVSIGWVNGNEGRVPKDIGFIDEVASDNYDEQIMRTLAYLFKDADGVTFIVGTNALELVVEVAGQHLLLVHGHTIGKDMSKGISKIRSKYVSRGIKIDYVIFGHIHEAYISDRFSRAGSPVGDNAYSDKGLNLCGRASQNFYVFYEDGSIDGIKADLQNVEGIDGYKTNKELHSYNAKSEERCNEQTIIHKIVI